MIKLQIGYIPEGPDTRDYLQRIKDEVRVYGLINMLEYNGRTVISESDNLEMPGRYYFVEFDTEYEAAMFKLNYL